jgi:hypothetical protein
MADRYDDNRERFEGNYQNRNYGQGRERGLEDWQGRENRYSDERNYPNDEGRYGNQRQFNEGYGNRGFNQGRQRDFSDNWRRVQDRDSYLNPGDMGTTYPRQNEWSSGSGVGTGLGGAENSEYSNRQRGEGYYGGQGSFGGGLSQFGEEGRHAGRGPKGYKRSDERIREDVNEHLTRDPHVDASEIEVEVKDGEVTLSGTVDGRQAKRRAEDIVENVSGVREVHNQLRVQSGQDRSAQDTARSTTGGAASGKQGSQSKEYASSGHQSSKS